MRRCALLLSLLTVGACDGSLGSPSIEGTNHRVEPGENLYSIAERAYGNGLEWPRIWEANPWLDPDHLRPDEIIHVPRRGDTWGDPPPPAVQPDRLASAPTSVEADGARLTSGNPGRSGIPGVQAFRNLASQVTSRTLFGLPVEQTLVVVFLAFVAHALLQSLFVWLAANLIFVKDASMKKATKAVFQAEFFTFSSVVVAALVGVLLLYGGRSDAAGAGTGAHLFPAVEEFLRSPSGIAASAFGLLFLYLVLSLRFLPQAFGLRRGHSVALVVLAVLAPHLGALYLMGQRLGLIS